MSTQILKTVGKTVRMATKTWKIGEQCQGGIITAKVSGNTITIIGKEWDFSKGSNRGSDQSNAQEFTRKTFDSRNTYAYNDIFDFISDLSTCYYADTIIEWIETKTKLGENVSPWLR